MLRGDDGSLEAEPTTPKDKEISKQRGIHDAVDLSQFGNKCQLCIYPHEIGTQFPNAGAYTLEWTV